MKKPHNQLVEDRVKELMATGLYDSAETYIEYFRGDKILGEVDYVLISKDDSHVLIGEAKTIDNNIGKAYHQLQRVVKTNLSLPARFEYISNSGVYDFTRFIEEHRMPHKRHLKAQREEQYKRSQQLFS